MHSPFALFPTLGKLVAIAADTNDLDKIDEGILKKFTGGDAMEFEQKYKDPITAIPTAKLIASANTLPNISDRTDAVWRRMIVLPFDAKIPEAEQKEEYTSETFWLQSGELPGILRQALLRYRASDRFINPQACQDARRLHQIESHSEKVFFLECAVLDPDGEWIKSYMYDAYREFCKRFGYHPLKSTRFGREVRQYLVGHGVAEWEGREASGTRYHVYRGIKQSACIAA